MTKSVLANKLKLLTYIPLSINRNNNTIKRICRLGNSCHLTNKVVLTLSVFSSGSQAQKSPWPLDGHTNIVLEEHEGSRERNSSYSIVYNSISCLIKNDKTSKLKKNIFTITEVFPPFFYSCWNNGQNCYHHWSMTSYDKF